MPCPALMPSAQHVQLSTLTRIRTLGSNADNVFHNNRAAARIIRGSLPCATGARTGAARGRRTTMWFLREFCLTSALNGCIMHATFTSRLRVTGPRHAGWLSKRHGPTISARGPLVVIRRSPLARLLRSAAMPMSLLARASFRTVAGAALVWCGN